MIHPCLRFATLNIIIQFLDLNGWPLWLRLRLNLKCFDVWCFAFDALSERIPIGIFSSSSAFHLPNRLTHKTIITLNKVMDRSIESSAHVHQICEPMCLCTYTVHGIKLQMNSTSEILQRYTES